MNKFNPPVAPKSANPHSMMRPPKRKLDAGTLKRVLKMLFGFYPVLLPISIVCIIFCAVTSAIPAIFLKEVTNAILQAVESGEAWDVVKGDIISKVAVLLGFYVASIIAITLETQLMAGITQSFLSKMRKALFAKMQNLPIKYFDTNKHGDIMSRYTNDIDTLRQLIGQSIPTLIRASVIVISVLFIMLYYSLYLTLILLLGVVLMVAVTKFFGGNSARFFMGLQKTVGKQEGFVQEMMSGQKVVKVFCHEETSQKDFDEINNELFEVGYRANACANMLGPIIMNIGNVLYVILAMVGCLFLVTEIPNPGIQSLFTGLVAIDAGIIVSFLSMAKQFTGNINQVSQQINSVVMAMAGAERVFTLMDTEPEVDDGYVTLVDAEILEDGSIREANHHTGVWAWKHPHSDGTVTYQQLRGDVRMADVDFSYEEGKPVLRGVSVFAEPGQKVAFVGATGAGKTTITNLINRFYDIADGKIRYDGININKIKKSDLRRSLGIVLQETNLFTGTVLDNIRYGKLDATDEECVEAAKLAGADDFITRLPEGYQTELTNNGANLSQGQRQLISIARAAVADPPVMILDEATSSIDTRTEAIVQKGMDALMKGRTVFVIAHRLSTVRNSDVIMVLDHGRIIERGNHEKLIAEKGQYYQLYKGVFELE